MADAIAHRGPDDEGLLVLPQVALAHRRLSIIDLSPAGRQPMSNEDGTVFVVFNGEIYNHRVLRRDLEARGHRFKSGTDTEVLVHLYEERGDNMVGALRGMFAFAIWDAKARRLFAARDRVGKKPFCYRFGPDRSFWFASEAKAFLAAGLAVEVDDEAIDQYLQLQYVPPPLSALRGVRKLAAAHTLVVEPGKPARIDRYWKLAYQPKLAVSFSAAARQLEHLIEEATACRLEADVPLGGFLSGGIDSSLVASMMVRAAAGRVKTYSVGFGGETPHELTYAREVARALGTDHEEMVIDPPSARSIERAVAIFDDPFGDPGALPMLSIAEAARRRVTVALTGDGGDESFAGYLHHRLMQNLSPLFNFSPTLRDRATRALLSALPRASDSVWVDRARRLLKVLRQPTVPDALAEVTLVVPPAVREALYQPDFYAAAVSRGRVARISDLLDATRGDWLDRMLGSDVDNYLADCLMTKTDIASMAVSLECRSPLLDQKVMEYAARLPTAFKVRGPQSKRVLRELARRILPRATVRRPKMGFAMPVDEWLRKDLRPMAMDLLAGSHPRVERYVRPEVVRRMLDEHAAGSRSWRRVLWSLLVLELWLRGLEGRAAAARAVAAARA